MKKKKIIKNSLGDFFRVEIYCCLNTLKKIIIKKNQNSNYRKKH